MNGWGKEPFDSHGNDFKTHFGVVKVVGYQVSCAYLKTRYAVRRRAWVGPTGPLATKSPAHISKLATRAYCVRKFFVENVEHSTI